MVTKAMTLSGPSLNLWRNHRFAVIAIVYTVANIVTDLLLPRDRSLSALLVIVPLLVAFEWGWQATAAVTVVPVVLTATNLLGYDHVPVNVMAPRLVAVAIGSALAVYASLELGRREALLTRSRAVADAAQQAILPTVPERLGAYVFSCLYRSSAEEALVGGDFYKVITSPFGQRLIVGDVEGKGLAAVGMSALVLGCFREWAPRTARLPDLVATLDERVHTYEERSAFVTAVVGSLGDDLVLELANCGHVFPILSRRGISTILAPEHTTTPLGFGPQPSVQRVQLQPGDRVLLYTDALTETRSPDGRWVTLDEVIGTVGSDPIDSVLANVAWRITTAGTLRDDLAMLLIEVTPDGRQDQAVPDPARRVPEYTSIDDPGHR
jgi:hypothetical protein